MTPSHAAANPSIDLDAYLQRIGYTGPRRPTLESLKAIQLSHIQSIAFENLNPLLGWPVALDALSLEQKLVRGGRGGYCFEQNLVLKDALAALGFDVTGLLARVLWMAPEGAVTPRTHMLLLVKLEGREYAVDAGFGAGTPTAPLRLLPDIVQQTPHGPFHLLEHQGEWLLEAQARSEWSPLYRFDLTPAHLVDYEVSNWYTATCPKSHFVHELTAAIAAPGCRYTLRNRDFGVHHTDGPTQRRTLETADALRDVLTSKFLLRLPEAPELDAVLKRVARAGSK